MADEHRHEHPSVRFEPTDIGIRGMLVVIAIFVLLFALQQFLTLRLFKHELRPSRQPDETRIGPLLRGESLPANPRLEQVDRLADVRTPDVYRRQSEKEEILQSYGPTTEKDFVHVPIHWAIEQAAKQLRWRAEKANQARHHRGLLDAGEPNSGRVFHGGSNP